MDKIRLNLSIYQEAILKKEFENIDGELKLNRLCDIGRFIYSQIKWTKDKPEDYEKGINVILPSDGTFNQYIHYPYLTKYERQVISDYLDATFALKANAFLVKGARHGYLQKNVIDAFIYHYGLPGTITTFEMIKQRDFRTRRNVKKIISEFLVNN